MQLPKVDGKAVRGLTFQLPPSTKGSSADLYTPILHTIPASFTNLTTLTLNRVHGFLPPPYTLPRLRALCVDHTFTPGPVTLEDSQWRWRQHNDETRGLVDLCTSLSAYTTQLTSFAFATERGGQLPWSLLFSAPTTSLTNYTTSYPLNDAAVERVIKNLPVLQDLSCGALDIHKDHSSTNWAVTRLCVAPDDDGLTSGAQLAMLPMTDGGVQLHAADDSVLRVAAGTVGEQVRPCHTQCRPAPGLHVDMQTMRPLCCKILTNCPAYAARAVCVRVCAHVRT